MKTGRIPFEIHITVADINESQISLFELICQRQGGKALLIELAQGDYCRQPMASVVIHKDNFDDARRVADEYAKEFCEAGFSANRIKIEISVEYLTSVPHTKPEGFAAYFEWHAKVVIQNLPLLLKLCVQHGAHLSRNALRTESTARFITLREYSDLTTFYRRINLLTQALQDGGWQITKAQAEYCVYDTHVDLDKGWLPQ